MKSLENVKITNAKQIEVGSYLLDSFYDTVACYKVISTSAKSVLLQRVWTKQTHFENAGGFTGYKYSVPTDKIYGEEKPVRRIAKNYFNSDEIYIPGPISKREMELYDSTTGICEYYE